MNKPCNICHNQNCLGDCWVNIWQSSPLPLKPNKPWTYTYEQELKDIQELDRKVKNFKLLGTITLMVIALLLVKGCNAPAMADTIIVKGYSNAQICEAIRKTENSRSHPYGIMTKYKHTTPKQACINSIKSARKRWENAGNPGDFVVFLGKTYSPPYINPNWTHLVHYFLVKG